MAINYFITINKSEIMQFRTEISVPVPEFKINFSDPVITIGSCFAENIAEYFGYYLFNILENPFGVLYNPVSLYNALKFSINNKQFSEDDLIFHQDEWHSFYHHSDFSHHVKKEILNRINLRTVETYRFLTSAKLLIISLGTAFVFRHKARNLIVSNCHKIPGNEFDRFMLPVDDVKEYLNKITQIVQSFNKNIKIIFTVSPVRHIRDGLHGNNLSKSTLLLAVDEVVKSVNNTAYFPSYEIVMDDLRDYRYYKKDLLHPNELAVDYIWEKFSEVCFTNECKEVIKETGKITRAVNHRPRNPGSPAHKKFIREILAKIEELERTYKHLNLAGQKKLLLMGTD